MNTQDFGQAQGAIPTRKRIFSVGFALFVLAGAVSTVLFVISLITTDWAGFNESFAHELSTRSGGRLSASWLGTAIQVTSLLVVFCLRVVVPVLLAWLVFGGRLWARVATTVYIVVLVIFTVGGDPLAYALASAQALATVLYWLPSSTVYLKKRRELKRNRPLPLKLDVRPFGRAKF